MTPEWVEQALKLVQANALRASEVDWTEVVPRVREHAAASIEAGRPEKALAPAFAALHDNHSFIEGPEAAVAVAAARIHPPVGRVFEQVRCLEVPAIRKATGSADSRSYVEAGLRAVQAIDRPGPLLVDLRANGGGNCIPMLAVVAPFLGRGELVSFRSPSGSADVFSYDGRAICLNGEWRIDSGALPQHQPDRIAVLTGPETASSGEVVLLAFRDRQHTRTFGLPTAGNTTANADYPLADGFMLFLAVSLMHSSTGVGYDGPVQPHVLQDPPEDVRAASDWLLSGEPPVRGQ